MFWSRNAKRARIVKRTEDLAGSLQLELYQSARADLRHRFDDATALRLAAALANYVLKFGFVNPEHASDPQFMDMFAAQKSKCLANFSDIFKANATGMLILLAAAEQMDLAAYKRHMRELAADGFVKHGRDTPDVSRSLQEDDLIYMYTLVSSDF